MLVTSQPRTAQWEQVWLEELVPLQKHKNLSELLRQPTQTGTDQSWKYYNSEEQLYTNIFYVSRISIVLRLCVCVSRSCYPSWILNGVE